MNFLMRFFHSINTFDAKKVYQAMGFILGLTVVLIGVILFYYYHSVNSLHKKIDILNESREEIRTILTKEEQVQQQHKAVNALLAEDPNFKIGGYFKSILEKLNLTEKNKKYVTEPIEREDNYRETRLNAEFVDMTMKELTELLSIIEQSARVYTKELDITRSKRTAHTVNVKLIIGTLQPKTAEGE